jgi:mannan endo-1,4-beta-mannosidase
LFSIVQQSVAGKKGIVGCNFWAFGGEGRPVKGRAIWKQEDSFLGDPPMEEQGLNSVFDSDKAIWELVRSFTKKGGL